MDNQVDDQEEIEMTATAQASLAGVTHQYAKVNGTGLHYVAAGTEGSPVLLVHGFPETWWTFRKLIPLLAISHRVFAVDLRGFGDSDNGPGTYDSKASAEDLHLITQPWPRSPHGPGHQWGDRSPPRRHPPRRRAQPYRDRDGPSRVRPRDAG